MSHLPNLTRLISEVYKVRVVAHTLAPLCCPLQPLGCGPHHQGFVALEFLAHSCYHLLFFSSRRRHTIFDCDWSSDVCSSDLRRHPLRHGLPACRECISQVVKEQAWEYATRAR